MGRIFRWSNFKKTVRYLRRNGIRQAYYAARERMDAEHREYYVYEEPPGEELSRQRELGKEFTCRFSILVPLYETEETYLRAMVESVLSQT